jgi:hypothetical protein
MRGRQQKSAPARGERHKPPARGGRTARSYRGGATAGGSRGGAVGHCDAPRAAQAAALRGTETLRGRLRGGRDCVEHGSLRSGPICSQVPPSDTALNWAEPPARGGRTARSYRGGATADGSSGGPAGHCDAPRAPARRARLRRAWLAALGRGTATLRTSLHSILSPSISLPPSPTSSSCTTRHAR